MTIPVSNTLYFPIYEQIKSSLSQKKDEKGMFGCQWNEAEFGLYAMSAAVAGTTVAIATNPLVVVRTRMQSEIFYNRDDFHF